MDRLENLRNELLLCAHEAGAVLFSFPKDKGFERVASLVLLALLCTTLAGLA